MLSVSKAARTFFRLGPGVEEGRCGDAGVSNAERGERCNTQNKIPIYCTLDSVMMACSRFVDRVFHRGTAVRPGTRRFTGKRLTTMFYKIKSSGDDHFNYIEQLTWLRGFAAFVVIVSHTIAATEVAYGAMDTGGRFAPLSLLDLGTFGVILFCVLTTYTHSTSNAFSEFGRRSSCPWFATWYFACCSPNTIGYNRRVTG